MDFNIEKAKILLNKIEELDKKYQDRVKKQEKNGRNYNVFYVLGLWSDEVKFHSAFIADLLNPNGWHGQGDVFLKEFLSILGYNDLITENANVEIEKKIGNVTKEEGGRLDISIELKRSRKNDFLIIIENKVYAEDQANQLIRYKNYAEKQFPDGHIILYLTPDGRNPKKKSVGFDPEKKECKPFWRNISYSYLIKEWLKRCIELMKGKETIKIVIWQYLALLLELTGQGGDCIMSTEIQKLLLKDHNLLYAEELCNEIEGVKQSIIDDKLKPLLEDISVKNCSLQDFDVKFERNKYYKFSFLIGGTYKICFEFQGTFCKELIYGITNTSGISKKEKEKISCLLIGGKNSEESNEYWLWWRYCEKDQPDGLDMRDWDCKTFDMILNNPDTIKQYFEKILNDTIKALKENNLIK